MSAAPFVTLFSPLTTIPILFGLVVGVWGCLVIIGKTYGLDLEANIPLVQSSPGLGAPLLLFGVAVFAFFRGQKIRDIKNHRKPEEAPKFGPLSTVEKLGFAGALLGILTLPYWFDLPMTEAWITGIAVLTIIAWKKFVN